jgi:hypothetical protein
MLINESAIEYAIRILELRTKAIELNITFTELGLDEHKETINYFNQKFAALFKNSIKYNFLDRINSGISLLVGEGNLSFTLSLVKQVQTLPTLTTSTYESYPELSDIGQYNAKLLRTIGIKVLHNIDATQLHRALPRFCFDTIIFQFPHSGSRESIEGHNPNFVLVHDFIISASYILKKGGRILITTVDNDFYNNMFRFEELSEELGLELPVKYNFDPKDYPQYIHINTNKDGSAIEDYEKFATWEFIT